MVWAPERATISWSVKPRCENDFVILIIIIVIVIVIVIIIVIVVVIVIVKVSSLSSYPTGGVKA